MPTSLRLSRLVGSRLLRRLGGLFLELISRPSQIPKIPGLEGSQGGSEEQPRESIAQSPSPDMDIIDFTSSPKKDSSILQLTTKTVVEDAKEDPPKRCRVVYLLVWPTEAFCIPLMFPFGGCKTFIPSGILFIYYALFLSCSFLVLVSLDICSTFYHILYLYLMDISVLFICFCTCIAWILRCLPIYLSVLISHGYLLFHIFCTCISWILRCL